jgi:hypothetical protein
MSTLRKKPFMTGHFNMGHSKAALNGVQILYDIRFGSAPEIQTDDLDGNKRSIGANVNYQREPCFESTGRR